MMNWKRSSFGKMENWKSEKSAIQPSPEIIIEDMTIYVCHTFSTSKMHTRKWCVFSIFWFYYLLSCSPWISWTSIMINNVAFYCCFVVLSTCVCFRVKNKKWPSIRLETASVRHWVDRNATTINSGDEQITIKKWIKRVICHDFSCFSFA